VRVLAERERARVAVVGRAEWGEEAAGELGTRPNHAVSLRRRLGGADQGGCAGFARAAV
jgi:hypothetical protein